MPITVTGDILAHDPITIHFEQNWTWLDLQKSLKQVSQSIDPNVRIQLVIDLQGSAEPPSLVHARSSTMLSKFFNTSVVVTVGLITHSSLVAYVLHRVYGVGEQIFFSDSLDKANRILSSAALS